MGANDAQLRAGSEKFPHAPSRCSQMTWCGGGCPRGRLFQNLTSEGQLFAFEPTRTMPACFNGVFQHLQLLIDRPASSRAFRWLKIFNCFGTNCSWRLPVFPANSQSGIWPTGNCVRVLLGMAKLILLSMGISAAMTAAFAV